MAGKRRRWRLGHFQPLVTLRAGILHTHVLEHLVARRDYVVLFADLFADLDQAGTAAAVLIRIRQVVLDTYPGKVCRRLPAPALAAGVADADGFFQHLIVVVELGWLVIEQLPLAVVEAFGFAPEAVVEQVGYLFFEKVDFFFLEGDFFVLEVDDFLQFEHFRRRIRLLFLFGFWRRFHAA